MSNRSIDATVGIPSAYAAEDEYRAEEARADRQVTSFIEDHQFFAL